MTNLKILLTVIGTLAVYTLVANIIPQVQSAVAEELVLTADTSPEDLVAMGEELFNGAGGCTACHGLGTRAPDLLGSIGTRCATRVPGEDCKTYLWESLTNPTAYVVEGFQPIMLNQSMLLSDAQLWTLVAFLESQGGEVTVTADDFASALTAKEPPGPGGAEAEAGSGAATTAETGQEVDPKKLIDTYGCLACHSLEGKGQQIGPAFETLKGKSLEYVRRSIVDPNADTAPGFEAFSGTMPPMFGTLMAPEEIDAVARLLAGGGEGGGDDGGR